MKKLFIQLPFILALNFVMAQQKEISHVSLSTVKAAIDISKTNTQFFIENKGQWPGEVLFKAEIGGADVWITRHGIVYDFYKNQNKTVKPQKKHSFKSEFLQEVPLQRPGKYGQVVTMTLLDANSDARKAGKGKNEGYYNYFLGKNPSMWASEVGLFKEATVTNIYKGIDVRYYFDKGQIRYDYIVHPGADAGQIRMSFAGTEHASVNDRNELVFMTRFGEVKQTGLFTYQVINGIQERVENRFHRKSDGSISFELSTYNRRLPLIIDPVIYSTFIGGSNASETGTSMAIDANGNAYVTGTTFASDFPVTPGAYEFNVYNEYSNFFVTKLNNTGSSLIYSTFIGGSFEDKGISIAIDATGSAYITGLTSSVDYPTTVGAFDETSNTEYYCDEYGYCYYFDAFVTKLNSTGSALVYSTLIGGSGGQEVFSIAIDGNKNAYITGNTNSSDFPVTAGSYDVTFDYGFDIFVVKLNNTGSGLIYSTFLGNGYALDITTDAGGNAYVTGGGPDAFVKKLNNTGMGLVYSASIGGTGNDIGISIILDGMENAYITGNTLSTDFPVSPNAYDGALGGPTDIFVAKLNSAGSTWLYSSVIGGSGTDQGNAIAIDEQGNAYVTGILFPPYYYDFPITPITYDASFNGDYDAFVFKLNSSGSALLYSTFLGGDGMDLGNSIAIGSDGSVYVAGTTSSAGFPTTPGAYDQTMGIWDAFVAKLEVTENTVFSFTAASNSPVCANEILHLSAFTTGGITPYTYAWTGPNGFSSNQQSLIIPNVTTAANGVYTVTVTDAAGNSGTATTPVSISVLPVASITASTPSCTTGCITLTASGGASYRWMGWGSSATITPCNSGQYILTAYSAEGCYDHDTIYIVKGTPLPTPVITQGSSQCGTGCITLTVSTGTSASYLWSTGSTSNSINACTAGTYSVVASNAEGCTKTAQVTLGTPVPCATPTQLVTTLITQNSARLNWPFDICATSYQVQYRKAGTSAWTTKTIPYGNVGYIDIKGLKRLTTYEWQIRAQCSPTVFSPYSSLVSFTTSANGARPGEETIVINDHQQINDVSQLTVYPNPASQEITVNVKGYIGKWRLSVTNHLGQQVLSKAVDLKQRETIVLNIATLPQGIYRVSLANDSGTVTGKFVKDR